MINAPRPRCAPSAGAARSPWAARRDRLPCAVRPFGPAPWRRRGADPGAPGSVAAAQPRSHQHSSLCRLGRKCRDSRFFLFLSDFSFINGGMPCACVSEPVPAGPCGPRPRCICFLFIWTNDFCWRGRDTLRRGSGLAEPGPGRFPPRLLYSSPRSNGPSPAGRELQARRLGPDNAPRRRLSGVG